MKALILAAGYGSRLGEITENTPKCLIKIGAETMLDHWLNKLVKLGVEDFFINTHYLSQKVENFVFKHPLKDKITLFHEKKLLGTAGTIIKHVEALNSEPFFIIHADNYCEDNLNAFLFSFRQRPSDTIMSMLTFTSQSPQDCGIVEVDNEQRLIAFHEKINNPPSNQANGAIYLASPNLFSEMPVNVDKFLDFSCDIIPKLLGKIHCFHTEEYFQDIGTPDSLVHTIDRVRYAHFREFK